MDWWMVALGAVAALLIVSKLRAGYRSPKQLRAIAEALANGATLVDVRTPAEFAGEHLPHALSVPLDVLSSSVQALERDQPIVVYCASGSRSAHAARLLRRAGFSQVLDLGPMFQGAKLPPITTKSAS